MPHRHGLRSAMSCGLAPALALALVGSAAGCESDKLKGPAAEVKKNDAKVNLPSVPGFELPPPSPDGSKSVKEMRVRGKKLLDTDVTVKGVVTWVYDCKTALRQPGMSDKDVEKLMYEDQTKCERAKFYIGDAADTPAHKSIWVVEVPRPFTKLELERMKPKAQQDELNNPSARRCDIKKKDNCPVYEVGDQVEVTGSWKLASSHGDSNSDGLLVYKKMKNVTKNWDAPEPPPETNAGGDSGGGGGGAKLSPEDMVKNKKPG